jgi:hypothetical protein
MNIITTRIDLKRTKDGWPNIEFRPALIIPRREDKRKWIILDGPILQNAPLNWADAASDEYIRIPLFEYILPAQADLAFSNIFELGVIAAQKLLLDLRLDNIAHLHIVTGDQLLLKTDAQNDLVSLSYWFGCAFAADN